MPRLNRFTEEHPDVEFDLIVDDGLCDIVAGRFDAGIRAGERLEKDVIAVRLTPDMELLAVASPEYLSRHGEPSMPAAETCTGRLVALLSRSLSLLFEQTSSAAGVAGLYHCLLDRGAFALNPAKRARDEMPAAGRSHVRRKSRR